MSGAPPTMATFEDAPLEEVVLDDPLLGDDEMPMTSSEAKVRDDALLDLVRARLQPDDHPHQGAT